MGPLLSLLSGSGGGGGGGGRRMFPGAEVLEGELDARCICTSAVCRHSVLGFKAAHPALFHCESVTSARIISQRSLESGHPESNFRIRAVPGKRRGRRGS